jgi:hypothetical protein
MLNASLGSPGREGSRDSPDIRTQPRLIPPAAGVCIEKADFWEEGEEKKSFD